MSPLSVSVLFIGGKIVGEMHHSSGELSIRAMVPSTMMEGGVLLQAHRPAEASSAPAC